MCFQAVATCNIGSGGRISHVRIPALSKVLFERRSTKNNREPCSRDMPLLDEIEIGAGGKKRRLTPFRGLHIGPLSTFPPDSASPVFLTFVSYHHLPSLKLASMVRSRYSHSFSALILCLRRTCTHRWLLVPLKSLELLNKLLKLVREPPRSLFISVHLHDGLQPRRKPSGF